MAAAAEPERLLPMNGLPQLKRRVLEALDLAVKQFRTREELYPLRVPREPLALDDVIRQALGEDHHRVAPLSLRSRVLLHLEWDDGSAWEVWVIVLPSGLKLFCDAGEEDARVLASGGRNAGLASDRLFLELLAESAGERFGIEMSGGAPARVRSAITDREFLVNVFTDLFEGAGVEESLQQHEPAGASLPTSDGDFRVTVEQWLDRALETGGGTTWRSSPRTS